MPNSSGTFERLRQELLAIKGQRSYQVMADECGLERSHLYRILNGQRQPYGSTIETLLAAYPQLAQVFVPAPDPQRSEGEPA